MTGADFGGVDIDLLADYIGGALDGTPEQSVVATRIADDPAWRAAYASLSEGMSLVSAELGRLVSEPMPADLADRLDTALTSATRPDAEAEPSDRTDALDALAAFELSDRADPLAAFEQSNRIDAIAEPELGRRADSITDAITDAEPGDRTDAVTGAEPRDRIDALARAELGDRINAAEAELGGRIDAVGGAGSDDRVDAVADAEPIPADLARPSMPHLTPVRGGLAGGQPTRGDLAGDDGARLVPETQRSPRRGRRLRWAAPIAVAAGLVAFVGFGLDYLAGRSAHNTATDSAAGGSAAAGKALAPTPLAGVTGQTQTLASGLDYTHATLGTAMLQPMTAPRTLSEGSGRKSTPEFATGVEPALQRLASPTALAECLAAIQQANAAGPVSVETVDYARFAGAPAVVVRFTAGNGRWAWASGADCGTQTAGAATLDKVPVG